MGQMTEEHFAVLRRQMVEVIAIQPSWRARSSARRRSTRGSGGHGARSSPPLRPRAAGCLAYHDAPLPIGFDKTISQPFIVAVMTDLLAPLPTDTVLEVGTGLGYQTAILAQLARQVWSVEMVEEFALEAEARLRAARMHQRRDPGRRRLARLGRACPVRQDPGGGRRRGAPPALVEQLGPAAVWCCRWARAGAGAHRRGQGCRGQVKLRELLPVRFSRLETMA